METSQLHKALVSRAVKNLRDRQETKAKALWNMHEQQTQKKTSGWSLSWYTYIGFKEQSPFGDAHMNIPELVSSLHADALVHINKESEINSLILLISEYVAKVLTICDSCLGVAYVHFPPYLHCVFKDLHIPLDPTAKLIDLKLSDAEQKGKEELYALNLLEITGI